MSRKILLHFIVLSIVMSFGGGCKDEESPSAPVKSNDGSPTVSGILPPGASPGIKVAIGGSNFGSEQDTGSVYVHDKEATIHLWSDSEVIFEMPNGVPSEVLGIDVVLTTGSGKTVTSQIDITPPHTYRVTSDHAMDHQPCWSPGGDRIYFSSTRSGNANWDIYHIPAMGGVAERVTYDDAPDFNPDIRHSSGELAWASQMRHSNNLEGDFEIFYGFPECPAPGSACTVTMLTDNESRDLDPAYAGTVHSGYSMAYTWEEVDQYGHFVAWKVMLRGTGGPYELTEGRQPNFSSNGRWVVYNYNDNIYKIPTDGGAPVQLTDTAHDWYPHWGWANDKIVFQRFNSGNAEDIMVMDSDGSNVQALVSTRSYEYCPTWSADCTKIVYYALVSGTYDIYVYVVP